ncbi:unnamed protein product [Haemonchus placei]|uniref:Nuclear transport factor 2 family protein n=1 Tax=Haemonchus placei TaxID=6290 RepID=A0A0N4W6Y5_HAEPC|nr:unnamed protein product [Haemonchus placei]
MFLLFPILALLVPISSAEDLETPLDDKETFETINSMYTNDLVWSDEWAKKALDWLKSPHYRQSEEADLIVGGRSLIDNADDKPVWQKIVDVLEIQNE